MQPINDMSYFGCLDSVMENSKVSVARDLGGQDKIRELIHCAAPSCCTRDAV